MKILLVGATGMVGQGAIRECLLAPDVERVIAIGRSPLGATDAKLVDIVHRDFADFSPIADRIAGVDACLFCLGITSTGMSEADYTKVTYDTTMALAGLLPPSTVFAFVSGAGTDSTEQGRSMWARVKGRTENALIARFGERAYMFRPGGIRPMHGIRSKTRSYRIGYAIAWPLLPLLQAVGAITTTERLGRAMVQVARAGSPAKILGTREINALGGSEPGE